jgi:putative ABC transport system permease protein
VFKSNIRSALRNLRKNKVSSFINIAGLAAGMAVALLIGLWVYDELSFDKYHQHYDRIVRLQQTQTYNGIKGTNNSMPFPLGKALQDGYGSDLKYVVMASWEGEHILTAGEKQLFQTGIYMDKDAPAMLSLKMLQGNYNGLKDPHSILLSASTTKAMFGDDNPIGKLVKIDNKLNVTVSGVYEDLPHNTEFRDLRFIAPWDLYVPSEHWIEVARDQAQWDNNSFQIYAQLADHADLDAVNKKIINLKQENVDPEDKKYNTEIFLQPMRDWHLRSHWENGRQTGGLIQSVWLFGVIGVFVLLLACINFMNLSTARSGNRAREVGIRKAIGSLRSQLISQFYSESLLVVLLAFAFSLLLVQLSLPWFNEIADKKMAIPWTSPLFWLLGLSFTFFTGIIAGSYPALYLSSFQPIKVLKGTPGFRTRIGRGTKPGRMFMKAGRSVSIPRKVLVTIQFTISLVLIIGTIIVYEQIQYTKNRPIGYNRDGLIMISMRSPDFYGKFDLLRTELKSAGAIGEMAESSSPLTDVWANNDGFEWPGKDPHVDADFATIWVTHDFGKTVGWQFKEGRDFSRDFATDSSAIILNEAAVKFMGLKHPVGTVVRRGKSNKPHMVVGVIKDMLMESPYANVKQTIYFMDYENVNIITLKLDPQKSASASIAKVAAVFEKYVPSAPFDYKFVSSEFAAKFAAEERIGDLSTVFAGLAIFISCLGLFGLASFAAEQRTKEIGIRKVLGASVGTLWGMLSKEFLILVGLSCLLAVPTAWYLMSEWLLQYTYRTPITWWVFAAATSGALVLTLCTVSFQAIKAALANPVESLRAE